MTDGKLSDLALVLEMAGRMHIITALSDPSTTSRRIYCSCGWKSEREKFRGSKGWPTLEALANQTRAHLLVAHAMEPRDDRDFHARWTRYSTLTASQFIQGKKDQ